MRKWAQVSQPAKSKWRRKHSANLAQTFPSGGDTSAYPPDDDVELRAELPKPPVREGEDVTEPPERLVPDR